MKRFTYLIIILCFSGSLWAAEQLSFSQLCSVDWQTLRGKQVCITTPLIVCGTGYDILYLSDERLYVPEELAVGLADGDSTDLFRIRDYNRAHCITLHGRYDYTNVCLGATLTRLTARVDSAGHLTTGKYLSPRNPRRASLPSMRSADMVICSANIQNFFYHLGGYASSRTTPGQYALQRRKIAAALLGMRADLFALCELEKGLSAPADLVAEMNRLARTSVYSFLPLRTTDGDTISVGFIYRSDRVTPCLSPVFAYKDSTAIYANRFVNQLWQFRPTGDRFLVSLNHLRSKRGEPEVAHRKRMANVDSILYCLQTMQEDPEYADYWEEDVLLLGDYNSYSMEAPIQSIIREGYAELLPSHDYSYSYMGEIGYLDHAFASPSMAEYVVFAQPYHCNVDYPYTWAYYHKNNFKDRIVPTSQPKDLRSVLSRKARRQLRFRYSDHDPILIGLRFR